MDTEPRLNFNEAQDKISKFFFGGDGSNNLAYNTGYGAPAPSYNAPTSYGGGGGYNYIPQRLVFLMLQTLATFIPHCWVKQWTLVMFVATWRRNIAT